MAVFIEMVELYWPPQDLTEMYGDWETMECNDSVSCYFIPLIAIKAGASYFGEAFVMQRVCKVLTGN